MNCLTRTTNDFRNQPHSRNETPGRYLKDRKRRLSKLADKRFDAECEVIGVNETITTKIAG